jgi:crotonobetainyl-CoA:carnitine CoA-transferase CaiB-like acyl-CoA transferase
MSNKGVQNQPLSGLGVVETGGGIATRYCGRLFAALGARVVQVDAVPIPAVEARGAAGRTFMAWLDADKEAADDLGAALSALNGGEGRPLVIAGQTPDAVERVDQALAAHGGPALRLGLTWFGDKGPYAGWRGHDAVIHALSGVAFGFGLPEGPPILPQGHAPQMLAGVVGLSGALAALMAGEQPPARVDVNVLETALCFMEMGAIAAAYMPELRSARNGINRYSPTFPSSIYATADGHVGLTALTPPQWTALCALMTEPDWAEAFRFFTSLDRLECADEIDAVLAPRFAEKPTAYWVEAGDRLRIPITPAERPKDLPGMPHWAVRGAFAPVAGTRVQAPILPFRFAFDAVISPRPAGGARGPLTGVRVADFSMGWAGPLAARYLADLGADVLKIESTVKPDWWRGWEVVEAQDPPLHELPRNFMAVNREKRGLDLDLASPPGKTAAEAIIRRADLVIENQGPGVMDRLGLGQADQRRLRPGIVSVAMPPFGHGGPLSGVRAYGSTVEQASGMPFVNGHSDWPPSMQHVAFGDPAVGLYGAAAALVGLYGRGGCGGVEIDLCQVECLFQLGADAIIADQIETLVRAGSRRPGEAPVCVVPARGEEDWLAVAVETGAAWRGLCAALADPGLSPHWSLAERKNREADIVAAIADWAADKPAAEAAAALQASGVAGAPVLPAHGLWRNEQLVACGYWAVQHRAYVGEHLTPRPPFRFDGERPPVSRPAPTLGQHTAEVLAELGGA